MGLLNRSAIVLAVALGVRVVYLIGFLSSPCNGFLLADHIYYREWALTIGQGDWWGQEAFEQGPLYAYLLAIGYHLGLSDLGILIIQMFVGIVTCLLVYLCGRHIFDERIAVVAACVTALYGPLIYYETELMKSFLSPFFVMLTLYFGQLYARSPRVIWVASAGASIGLACLVRESYVLLALPMALWIWMVRKDSVAVPRRLRFGHLLVLVVSLALTIAPATLRNYLVTGELVFVTTGGGEVMYIAHGPGADGYWGHGALASAKMNPRMEHQGYRDEAAKRLGHAVTASESSRYWYGEALREIIAHPGRFLWLTGKRAVILGNNFEVPDSSDFQTWRVIIPVLSFLPTFGWISGLAMIGMVVSLPSVRRCGLALGFALAIATAVLLTYNFGRFRIGMIPICILFATAGIFHFVSLCRSIDLRQRSQAGILACVCLGITVVSFIPPPGKDNVYSEDIQQYWQDQISSRWQARQKVSALTRKRELDADGHAELGHYLMESGHISDSFDHYRVAMQLAPKNPRHPVAFSRDLFVNGYEQESIDLVKTAIQVDPDYGGMTAQNMIMHVIQERPDFAQKYGDKLIELGQQASDATQKANPALLGALAMMYARSNRLEEAIATAEQALSRTKAKQDQRLIATLEHFLHACRQRRERGDR